MDWFGITIIVAPIVGLMLMVLDLWHQSRKEAHTPPPPRARPIRASYGPGYHPVLNWNWDEAYTGWVTPCYHPIWRRVNLKMNMWAKAMEAVWRQVMIASKAFQDFTTYVEQQPE